MAKFPTEVERSITVRAPLAAAYSYLWDVAGSSTCIPGLQRCEGIGGDTYRNLQVQASYSGQTFKHILAPVWLLSYSYGSKVFQAALNGFTGAIQGEYPRSWIKVTLLALAIVVAILVAFSLGTHR